MDERHHALFNVNDESPQRSRYVRSWRRLKAGCIAVAFLVAIDWTIWKYRDFQLCHTASEVCDFIGGIGGWPLGMDYVIRFDIVPTSRQLEILDALNHPPRTSSVVVYINSCDLTKTDMLRVSAALKNCRVNKKSCDDDVNSPNSGKE